MALSTIDELSGGQFQRMLFARVLVQQAPLVMLDEPFTGVDESDLQRADGSDAGDVYAGANAARGTARQRARGAPLPADAAAGR